MCFRLSLKIGKIQTQCFGEWHIGICHSHIFQWSKPQIMNKKYAKCMASVFCYHYQLLTVNPTADYNPIWHSVNLLSLPNLPQHICTAWCFILGTFQRENKALVLCVLFKFDKYIDTDMGKIVNFVYCLHVLCIPAMDIFLKIGVAIISEISWSFNVTVYKTHCAWFCVPILTYRADRATAYSLKHHQ